MPRMLKRKSPAKTFRLYFERDAAILPTAPGQARVEFKAGAWYDGVSAEHRRAVGEAAVELTLDLECGCLLTPEGRAVVTRTVEVPDHTPEGQPFMRPEVSVTLQAHAEACAFEQEEE